MREYKKVLLSQASTIKEALKVIDSGAMKIALVTEDDGTLIGTLTDGDIRRGLLSHLGLDDSIESIIFTNPTTCREDDSRESILKVALKKKIYQIPVVDAEGKLLGLRNVDELIEPKRKTNRVVLMVGGLGTRLRPLTEELPKPMLKVGDRPILETIILNFKKHGFENIILSVNYKSEVIKEYFKDGSAFGVNIEYIHESKRLGTAGALSLMKEQLSEPFFVMNGDLLTNIDFENMMEYHLTKESVATMGVREYDFQVPYGVVQTEGEDITAIVEKPTHKFFVNAGIYILDSSALELIPNDEFFDMPTLFEKFIENRMKNISFPIHEYWLDIGRMEEFKQANDEFLEIF